jgi:glycosyltransferase involved in cell wall biosynthesis
VLVSASRHEGSPLVVREARALGVPVVACPSGDLEQWARDDAGLWVLPASLDAESA